MFNVIVACAEQFGIGLDNKMAWHCPEELALFKERTMDSVLIMGRKTVENLPKLKDRYIICLSKQDKLNTSSYKNNVTTCKSLKDALLLASQAYSGKKVFVAGGTQIYDECLNTDNIHHVDKLYISIMKKDFAAKNKVKCDTNLNITMFDWVIEQQTEYKDFHHWVLLYRPNGEMQYLDLLHLVMTSGSLRKGRNGITKSLFAKQLSFDLREGFPLITTKKMFIRGMIEELLFFLRGDTDSKKLEGKNIHIWTGNTNRQFLDSVGMKDRDSGIMGPMYGYQWRFFGAPYDEEKASPSKQPGEFQGIDQLKEVVSLIRTDPTSRRILMTDYNPIQAKEGVLYPCHSIIIQFYVDKNEMTEPNGYLDMFCYNRSSDLLLGLPFNIASSALLLEIVAKMTNLTPRQLTISLGDVHIYEQHFDAVQTQISRHPYAFPTLKIMKDIKEVQDIDALCVNDFVLEGYLYYPSIKAEMIA